MPFRKNLNVASLLPIAKRNQISADSPPCWLMSFLDEEVDCALKMTMGQRPVRTNSTDCIKYNMEDITVSTHRHCSSFLVSLQLAHGMYQGLKSSARIGPVWQIL